MHIQKIEIRNIKSIKAFDFELEPHELAGWHVLIGDNGSGKSTVLKAISFGLVGPAIGGIVEIWEEWFLEHMKQSYIDIKVTMQDSYEDSTHQTIDLRLGFRNIPDENQDKSVFSLVNEKSASFWMGDKLGKFSTAYGPFRRFTGGSSEHDSLSRSKYKIGAHLSIFSEGVALSESIQWLQDLRFQELEARETGQTEGFFLDRMRHFINQDEFLPYSVSLHKVTSSGVFFTDANSNSITVQNLSDGYRSILSMTFDIIRQMQIAYQTDDLFSEDFANVKMPGVVLIDEVDAHLHPTWQRKIGPWFRQHFPNVQFIVTTHSPLICQAAAEGGSVWKLPRPGTDETCVRVTGQDLNRLFYGNILEAYSTQLFGLETTQSDEGKEKLKQLAQLNMKEVLEGLSEEEIEEQIELRAMFPTKANTLKA